MMTELQSLRDAELLMLGWRARVGLLIPQLDYLSEGLLPYYLPSGISFHTSRLRRTGPVNAETLGAMNASISEGVSLLPLSCLNALVYHCTMGSLLYEPSRLVEDLKKETGLAVVATAQAALDALGPLGARRICLVTPYSAALNRYEAEFLEAHGLEVASIGGANIDDSFEMQRVAPEEIAVWVRRAKTSPVDAIFVSCTGIRSHSIVDRLEADHGCPIVTSLSAMLWGLLGALGLPQHIPGLGRLLR